MGRRLVGFCRLHGVVSVSEHSDSGRSSDSDLGAGLRCWEAHEHPFGQPAELIARSWKPFHSLLTETSPNSGDIHQKTKSPDTQLSSPCAPSDGYCIPFPCKMDTGAKLTGTTRRNNRQRKRLCQRSISENSGLDASCYVLLARTLRHRPLPAVGELPALAVHCNSATVSQKMWGDSFTAIEAELRRRAAEGRRMLCAGAASG